MTKKNTLTALSLALMASVSASAAFAQNTDGADRQIDSIIVTAQKRGQNLQDVPIAIAAISGKKLQDKVVLDSLDLTNMVPGLQINSLFKGSNPTIFLRGVGVNDTNPGSSGAVGVSIDDVFLNSSAGQLFQVYDVDRIEVLKGPQGTLYGRNTTGGMVNYHTAQPTFDPQVMGNLTYGRFNQVFFEGAVGGPLIPDVLAARATVSYKRRDGWAINRQDGRDLNDIDSLAGRFQLLFQPNDSITITNKAEGGRSDTSALAHKAPGVFNAAEGRPCTGDEILAIGLCTNPIVNYTDTSDLDSVNTNVLNNFEKLTNFGDRLKINWAGDNVSITSVSAYIWNKRELNQDQDGTPFSLVETPVWDQESEQFSQELRIESTGDGPLTWVAGLYYLHEELQVINDISLFREFNPDTTMPYFDPANGIMLIERDYTQKTESRAIFAQADYELTDKLTLTAGIRYTSDEKKLDLISVAGPQNPDATRFERLETPVIGLIDSDITNSTIDAPVQTKDKLKKPAWRLAVAYRPTDSFNTYFSYSRGVRSGGRNSGAVFDPIEFTLVEPEQIDAFEAGFKSDLFDRKLRANMAVFYYDYRDMQVFSLQSGPGGIVQRLQNADAEIYGVDGEITALPLPGLEVNLGFAAVSAKYTDFIDPIRGDFKGSRLDKTPKLHLVGGFEYKKPLNEGWEGFIGADFSYQTKVFLDATNSSPQFADAHGEVNAHLGIGNPDRGMELRLFAKNIANERYLLDMNDITTFGGWFPAHNAPRSYGVTVSYRR